MSDGPDGPYCARVVGCNKSHAALLGAQANNAKTYDMLPSGELLAVTAATFHEHYPPVVMRGWLPPRAIQSAKFYIWYDSMSEWHVVEVEGQLPRNARGEPIPPPPAKRHDTGDRSRTGKVIWETIID